MPRALVAVLVAVSAAAAAQTAPATPPTGEASKPAGDDAQQDVDQKIEDAKKEMREEIRAQMATQAAGQGWDEEWTEQARKLELLEFDGYLRVRPDLFHKLDLNRSPDPSGFRLFPPCGSPRVEECALVTGNERTMAGANMRMRFEPTINVSEEVRIRLQIDALDNLVFGSSSAFATGSDRFEFGALSNTQVPTSAIDALQDSIVVKRAYGEVSTPIGILRFGRMGSHWGLGMLHNDGNCLDCDYGDTVDRIQFVTEPFSGWYLTPMVDFDLEGPISGTDAGQGQPVDLSNTDDSHSYILAIARRDTEQQERAKLDNGLSVFNYGLHFTYRVQRFDPVGLAADPVDPRARQSRHATLYFPDVWGKFERKTFRLELEGAAVLGTLDAEVGPPEDRRSQELSLVQFGAVGRGEYRFMDGQLRLGLEAGFASGDKRPGLGNRPARKNSDPDGNTLPGDIDGRQWCAVTCSDTDITNFQFNREFRPDLILYREILGGITDSIYVKPTLTYSVAEGFDIFGSLIGSGAVYEQSTPADSRLLGLEINAGARYETEDGFIASLQWGILFPQKGLHNVPLNTSDPVEELETAQVLRAILGIKY
jgi:uncharacterized protein (TIGR04551 family)